jgi:hypothetical protein
LAAWKKTVEKSFVDFKADIRALGTYLYDAGIKNEKISTSYS